MNTPTITSVVVVDPQFDAYESLASAAQHGLCTVHFRSSGAAALQLLSKRRTDAVIVGPDLDDMSGQDFVDLLGARRPAAHQAASRPVVVMAEAFAAPRMAAKRGRPMDGDGVVRHPVLWQEVENRVWGRTIRGRAGERTAFSMRALSTLPVGASIATLAISALLLR